jgi:hypothetical protein
MSWRLAGREHLDDAHAAAAAWASTRLRGQCVILIGFRLGLARGSMQGQQVSRLGNVLSAIAVGKEAVVADAVSRVTTVGS